MTELYALLPVTRLQSMPVLYIIAIYQMVEYDRTICIIASDQMVEYDRTICIIASDQMVEYDGTIHHCQLPDGRV